MRWRLFPRRPPPAIRALRSAEADAVAAIHAEAFHSPWSCSDIEQLLTDPAMLADGARGGRAGSALLGFVLTRQAAGEAEMLSIAVASYARGRGVGRALLGAHQARLAQAGVRNLFLEVEESNASARALYTRAGFVAVGRREAYYRKPDGSVAAALILRLDL